MLQNVENAVLNLWFTNFASLILFYLSVLFSIFTSTHKQIDFVNKNFYESDTKGQWSLDHLYLTIRQKSIYWHFLTLNEKWWDTFKQIMYLKDLIESSKRNLPNCIESICKTSVENRNRANSGITLQFCVLDQINFLWETLNLITISNWSTLTNNSGRTLTVTIVVVVVVNVVIVVIVD